MVLAIFWHDFGPKAAGGQLLGLEISASKLLFIQDLEAELLPGIGRQGMRQVRHHRHEFS